MAEEMPLRFAQERLADIWDEALALAKLNHLETGALSHEDFQPNQTRYLALEKDRLLWTFTARTEDNRLVGYALFLVVPHLHYPSMTWAMQDVLYVHPEFRGVGAVRFMMRQDSALQAAGVHVVYRHVAARHDYSRTLTGIGYVPVETSFLKRL